MGIKAKDVAKKLDKYEELKELVEDIEGILSLIEEAEKKEKEVDIVATKASSYTITTTTAWVSNYADEHLTPYTTISINRNITSLIKDDIKKSLRKNLVEIEKQIDKLEI